jgi:hypothetical protein
MECQLSLVEVFMNVFRAIPSGGRCIVIAADRYDIYSGVVRICQIEVETVLSRHVTRETGRRTHEFYESVFTRRKPQPSLSFTSPLHSEEVLMNWNQLLDPPDPLLLVASFLMFSLIFATCFLPVFFRNRRRRRRLFPQRWYWLPVLFLNRLNAHVSLSSRNLSPSLIFYGVFLPPRPPRDTVEQPAVSRG